MASYPDPLLDLYVAEINTHPILNRKEEFALAEAYQQGNMRAGQKLVLANLRFVVKVAHGYRGYGLKLSDMIQEGNMGLLMAIKKFEVKRGNRLISYAVWWIKAYIQSFILRSWSLVKVGTTQIQRKLFFKLRKERDLLQRAGEVASIEALGQKLNADPHEIEEMQARLSAHDLSLDAELKEGAKQTYVDLLPSEFTNQEEDYASHELKALLRGKIFELLKVFSEKERYIVWHRLMSEEPKTLQTIGNHFHISRERARQIEGQVLEKIRSALVASGVTSLAA